MRRLSIPLAALMCALPVFVSGQDAAPQIEPVTPWSDEQLTVEQIEHVLAVLHKESDKDLARELAGLHLTQRLAAARLERLNSELPGKETMQALLAIADEAAFLDLPPADQLDLQAPDRAAQGRIVSQAAEFVATSVSRMPNFTATRTTTRFQDANVTRLIAKHHLIFVQGFRFIDRHEVTAVYRDGKEVDQGIKTNKPEKNILSKTGLYSWGEFGPLLGVVVADLLKGKIGWSHWEQTVDGPAAVFRFTVNANRSRYIVHYCCDSKDGAAKELKATPAYHGDIAIEPVTGAVLRIVLKADLAPDLDLSRADLAVDYKRIDIEGRSYILPTRSISLSKAPTVVAINDVVFDHYHQFRGEMRIVPPDGRDKPQ